MDFKFIIDAIKTGANIKQIAASNGNKKAKRKKIKSLLVDLHKKHNLELPDILKEENNE